MKPSISLFLLASIFLLSALLNEAAGNCPKGKSGPGCKVIHRRCPDRTEPTRLFSWVALAGTCDDHSCKTPKTLSDAKARCHEQGYRLFDFGVFTTLPIGSRYQVDLMMEEMLQTRHYGDNVQSWTTYKHKGQDVVYNLARTGTSVNLFRSNQLSDVICTGVWKTWPVSHKGGEFLLARLDSRAFSFNYSPKTCEHNGYQSFTPAHSDFLRDTTEALRDIGAFAHQFRFGWATGKTPTRDYFRLNAGRHPSFHYQGSGHANSDYALCYGCQEGYSGKWCKPKCAIHCMNGGVCSGSKCTCPADFTNPDCSIRNCLNGGVSVGRKCSCSTGFHGTRCEHRR
ncbi:uncharacterized protein LOC135824779 [Sycon ciliatum]|uniref:uncharacterized protein LOC135824779 n=1 Tax=Sycon ciliatum TaxID=27933 RepID=UPI0031F5F1B1